MYSIYHVQYLPCTLNFVNLSVAIRALNTLALLLLNSKINMSLLNSKIIYEVLANVRESEVLANFTGPKKLDYINIQDKK
jgi:hypothetical protein